MMKICSAIHDPSELEMTSQADLVEMDLDIFESLKEKPDKPVIIRIDEWKQLFGWKDPVDNGYIDIGEFDRPSRSDLKIIASVRDFNRTWTDEQIADKLNSFDCDIAKGVFKIIRPSDLMSLYNASKAIEKPHILLGSGEMGLITRMRPQVLGNEFTYAHTGRPNHPGQLSAEEMKEKDDDCLLLGMLGHPIRNDINKNMMIRAMDDAGIKGYYLNFDVTTIEYMDEVIRSYQIRGLNVGLPFKKDINVYIDKLDKPAEMTGAVNTINNVGSGLIGSNTDVYGALYAFKRADVTIENGMKVLIIGSGGVARACAFVCNEGKAELTVTGKNPRLSKEMSKRFGCEIASDDDPSKYDMIINCNPIEKVKDEGYQIDLTKVGKEQIIFDITYKDESPLTSVARSLGCKRVSGLDMVIGQAIKSFEIWTGRTADHDSLKRSILPETR